jgi:hypothetical protein
MSHETLRTLVREDATGAEPALDLSVDDVLGAGRRSVRRRRLASGLASAAVLAAVAAAAGGAVLPGAGHDRPALDAAAQQALEQYDARLMPAVVDATVRRAVGDDASALTRSEVHAEDGQGNVLPERYLRHTSMWLGSYAWGDQDLLRVALLHSRSEAEGDPEEYCRAEQADGWSIACEATTDADGNAVVTSVVALRPDHSFPGGGERTWRVVQHPEAGDPSRLWFQRTVEVRRGGVYVTSAGETVHAPSYVAAQRAWRLGSATLRDIADDPSMVFPPPQKDADGCDFVLPGSGSGTTC